MIEVYRGSINAWDDGALNVRFYVAKMMEDELAGVEDTLWGSPMRSRSRALSTLAPHDRHIRFMREAKAGERDAGLRA